MIHSIIIGNELGESSQVHRGRRVVRSRVDDREHISKRGEKRVSRKVAEGSTNVRKERRTTESRLKPKQESMSDGEIDR
jgi:hypothetical protein